MAENKLVVWPTIDNSFWGLKKDRKAEVTKEYFRNGETHYKGVWLDTKEIFDLPSVFFTDAELEELLNSMKK
jgi:hypothetical protein